MTCRDPGTGERMTTDEFASLSAGFIDRDKESSRTTPQLSPKNSPSLPFHNGIALNTRVGNREEVPDTSFVLKQESVLTS